MTIHTTNPFAGDPDPVRRFRGRLGGAVSLWTAGAEDERAGLTVSSLMVANGEPARILGLLDPDSIFAERLESTGLAVVHLLEWEDHGLADVFGGVAPAPGGAFRLGEWAQGGHGPVLADRTHALVRLETLTDVGWSALATTAVEEIVMVTDRQPLEHRRGRYQRPADGG